MEFKRMNDSFKFQENQQSAEAVEFTYGEFKVIYWNRRQGKGFIFRPSGLPDGSWIRNCYYGGLFMRPAPTGKIWVPFNAEKFAQYPAATREQKEFPASKPLPIYNEENVKKAIAAGEPVCIAANEETVELLLSSGIAATCCIGGMSGWQPHHREIFRNAPQVVLLPDGRDPLCRGYAERIRRNLNSVAKWVRSYGAAEPMAAGAVAPSDNSPSALTAEAPRQTAGLNTGAETKTDAAGIPVEPDRSELEKFIPALFKHATAGNRVSLRAFPEGNSSKPLKISSHILTGKLKDLINQAFQIAEFAARHQEKVVFSPPAATFTSNADNWHAREEDLAEGLVLNAECDAHPQAARIRLEQLFGPATMVVESGGEWINPETGKVEQKIHWYLRLKVPARSQDELAKLKEARRLMTLLVSGDTTNITIVHPIRWPGSVHRKREPKLCRVVSLNPEIEIDLDEAFEILRKAVETAGLPEPLTRGQRLRKPQSVQPKIDLPEGFHETWGEADEQPGPTVDWGPPPTLEAVARGCPWVAEMVEKGGKGYSEPPWFLSVFLATFIENGGEVVHKFSCGYEGYTKQETDAKYAEQAHKKGMGPPLCATIATAAKDCSKACEGCPKLALGKTPLHWADLPEPIGAVPIITGIARLGTAAPTGIPTGAAAPVQEKLPLIIELGTRLWGSLAINGREYRFGADQSKAIDPRKGVWFDFAANQGGYIKDLMEQAGKTRIAEVKPIEGVPLTVDEWRARQLDDLDPLMGEVLTTTTRAILNATTGIGKTNFGMAVAGHIGAGRDFLHWCCPRPRNVLYIDGEMSRRLFRARIADVVRRLDGAPTRAHFFSKEDIEGFAPLNTAEGQAAVWKLIEEAERRSGVKLDFIIFDSIMALLLGDMKEEDAWRDTQPMIMALTKRQIGQLWVHHTGHDTSRGYGTKTKEWQVDLVMHLDLIERPDTDVAFALTFQKARERTPVNRSDFAPVNIALIDDRWEGVVVNVKGDLGRNTEILKFFEALQVAAAASKVGSINGCPTASIEEWRLACVNLGLLDKEKTAGSRSRFSRHKLTLIAKNWIRSNTEFAWILP
jgi:hypothetical protein